MKGPKFNPGDIVDYQYGGPMVRCKVDAIDYCTSWTNFGNGPSTTDTNRWFYRLVDENGNEVAICTDGVEVGNAWTITLIQGSVGAKKWIKDFSFC